MASLSGKRGERTHRVQSLRSFGVSCGCVVLVAVWSFGGCSRIEGPCWIEGQDPEKYPIDQADCLSTDPCVEKCITDYKGAADKCAEIGNSGEQQSCEEEAYDFFYKDCRQLCREEDCADRQADCQEAESCSGQAEPDTALCAFCFDDCYAARPYRRGECFSCGFQ